MLPQDLNNVAYPGRFTRIERRQSGRYRSSLNAGTTKLRVVAVSYADEHETAFTAKLSFSEQAPVKQWIWRGWKERTP